MRAMTIVNNEAVELPNDAILFRQLAKSVEMTTGCDACKARATQHIECATQYFSSYRCNEHGGECLINHPDFKDQTVRVEILGNRHWLTYKNGVIQTESRGQ